MLVLAEVLASITYKMKLHLLFVFLCLVLPAPAFSQEPLDNQTITEKFDGFLEPIARTADQIVFYSVPLGEDQSIPVVLVLLAGTALFLTLYFKFINLRSFRLAINTVRGKYSSKDDPGQITHFQALSTALSATVGLGNIAGVAVAIGLGGPGAVFWMVVMGFMGMTSKFTECTLGVKYRTIDDKGKVSGGGMLYLTKGLSERGWPFFGKVLAVFFAVACVGGAIGAGNMFQINQSTAQVVETFHLPEDKKWLFGLLVALIVGSVIIGGIKSIAKVTTFLVPIMTIVYVLACLVVLAGHFTEIPAALGVIIEDAFSGQAALGGFVGGLIQGIKRGVFSNEAGLGSAAIAHAAVKTRRPASEGVVALLEPFIDTVVICLMSALVIVTTGVWKADASTQGALMLHAEPSREAKVILEVPNDSLVKVLSLGEEDPRAGVVSSSLKSAEDEGKDWVFVKLTEFNEEGFVQAPQLVDRTGWGGGIWLTSRSFGSVISWFPYVLTVAVVLFAFSTMICWYYYGEQALSFLVNGNAIALLVFKIFFCLSVVVGAAASLSNVLLLSDAMYFAMVLPNLIGLYFLLPVVKEELKRFQNFTKQVDGGASVEEADHS